MDFVNDGIDMSDKAGRDDNLYSPSGTVVCLFSIKLERNINSLDQNSR